MTPPVALILIGSALSTATFATALIWLRHGWHMSEPARAAVASGFALSVLVAAALISSGIGRVVG